MTDNINTADDATSNPQAPGDDALTRACVRHHLALGWWSLLTFLTLGVVPEILHGTKTGWYLNIANETRRLMWTLAHAHGTLLALVHIAFAVSQNMIPDWIQARRRLASRSLTAAGLLIPGGFFFGGTQFYGGDPGPGILLLPAGAICLFVAVLLSAIAVSSKQHSG